MSPEALFLLAFGNGSTPLSLLFWGFVCASSIAAAVLIAIQSRERKG